MGSHNLSVKSDVRWNTPSEFVGAFHFNLDGLRWMLTTTHVNWGMAYLRSPCCGRKYSKPNYARPEPFCKNCYTPIPYGPDQKLTHFSLWQMGEFLAVPIEHHFEPLTASLIGEDVQGICLAAYHAWLPFRSADQSVPHYKRESHHSRVARGHKAPVEKLNGTTFELGEWAATFTPRGW